MSINEIALFEDTDLEKLEKKVNDYIDSCRIDKNYDDIDIADIRFNSVFIPHPVQSNVLYTVMIIHKPATH